uniref:Adenosine deaminase n=1 Tax=Panagrellus redivivus TaxID=6233 RepID=A0A7E4ZR77_PANRE
MSCIFVRTNAMAALSEVQTRELKRTVMGQALQLVTGTPTKMVHPPVVDAKVRQELNFPKVELHLHLDGAVRHTTLFELAQQKKMDLKGAKSVEELKQLIVSHEPANLSKVLAAFDIFLPVIAGDAVAIERVAYEHCEDQANDGVIYFEARYSPHLLCNSVHKVWNDLADQTGELTPQGVIEAVKRGLDRGEKDFNVKARSILCCIRGYEDWNNEVLELAEKNKHLGVVSIDVAGCAHGADEQYEPSVIRVFQGAADRGIHRTVHAGESGGPKEVVLALTEMKAERIGHGYRLTNDEAAYQKYAVEQRVHFEACPYSSLMTGAVPLNWQEHPLIRWAKDNVNFSINTDDPTCFDNTVTSDLRIAQHEIGLSIHQLWLCQLNAAEASFLPDDEKAELVERIKKAEPAKN